MQAPVLAPVGQIAWTANGAVRYLDQTELPLKEVHREARSVEEMVEAIQALRIRGAPLIGVAAAMGLAAAAAQAASDGDLTRRWLRSAAERLASARPTAVNLRWAIDRMVACAETRLAAGGSPADVAKGLRYEAQAIWEEDAAMCDAIGAAGVGVIPGGAAVLTHCNAGALATGGSGTALAVIFEAHARGKEPRVVATETRPLRQGARLTTWELHKAGIPVTAVVDSAAAAMLGRGGIHVVITGADRIARNGDTANKIGTYGIAVAAHANGVPFYVAAPSTTFDLSLESGRRIPIEERSENEFDAAPGVYRYNPAFDVTPARLITAFITDKGLIRPPFEEAIPATIGQAAQQMRGS